MPVEPGWALERIADLRLTEGKWAGQRINLLDFQTEQISQILKIGSDGNRLVNEYLLGVARKNAKTTLIAALALTLLVWDEEPGGNVIIAAGKRDQARLLFRAACAMAMASTWGGRPIGAKRPGEAILQVQRDRIYFPEMDSYIIPVSADAQNEQGLNPNVSIVDELHVAAEKDRDLYDALITAQGARDNPLMISLTTAGPIPAGPCYDLYKYGLDIAAGIKNDPSFKMKWYEAAPDLEITDPVYWQQANPGLILGNPGRSIVNERGIRRQANAVVEGRLPEYTFRRLHGNQWTTATERWLPWRKWNACGELPRIPDGAPIYVGVDAALSRDTFGIAWVWVEPNAITVEHETESGLLIPRSVSVAHLCVKKFEAPREGDYIDPADVEMFLLGLASKYAIIEVAYDPAYMGLMAAALSDRGLPMEPFAQSPEKMTMATETLQRLAIDERIRHGNDPVLNKEMGGVGVAPTERGVRISKRKSGLKIDCAVASAMALQIALGEEDEPQDFAFVV